MPKRLSLVIDQERCINCETCTVACKMENNPTTGPWIRVETVGGGQKNTPAGEFPNLRMDFLPRLCAHCARPPCVDVCPTEALWKREDGIVILEKGKCNGCQACVPACPYEAILYSSKSNLAEKCNLCAHRVDQGLEPFCVICCEGQALHFGDLNDPSSHVSQLIATRGNAFTLIPEAGTNPSVNYLPPREKRGL